MDTFRSIFGLGLDEPLGLVVGLLLLAFLLGLLYFGYRALSAQRFPSNRRGKQARLAVADATVVSERRRLVLVRRDDVEHLILIGGPNDLVIESNIIRTAPARPITRTDSSIEPETPKPVKVEPVPPTPPPAARIDRPTPPRAEPAATPDVPVRPVVSTTAPRPVAAPARVQPAVTPPPTSPQPTSAAAPSVSGQDDRSMVDEMDALLNEITPPAR